MPKRTKKKTSVKQKQKVKVIVNVNNKTARRRRYAPRQPQQIIIQQPSMVSRDLPMPMFNPIQQASAPPVFQGVGQMLQPPNELLRNIYRETPDFENYNQMPYMQTNLQAPQFEEPAEIQREVASAGSSVSKSNLSGTATADYSSLSEPRGVDAETILSRPLFQANSILGKMVDVNSVNKGFDEPVPKDIPLPEMIKPNRVHFSDDEASVPKTIDLRKTPKIIQNLNLGDETDTSRALTTTTKIPKRKKKQEQISEPNELQIVAHDVFTFGTPKPRGRGRPSNKLISTEGKIENRIYNLIMNSTASTLDRSHVHGLNELLRGIGARYYQKMKKDEKIKYLLDYQKKERDGNKLFVDNLIAQVD